MRWKPEVAECRVCHGWGICGQDRRCIPCKVWLYTNSEVAQCRRCGFVEIVSPNRVCRLCYITAVPDAPRQRPPDHVPAFGEPAQLILILPGAVRSPASTTRWSWPRPPWLRSGTVPPLDDESICPALPDGQLLLVSPPRQFSRALAARIEGRWIPGFEEVAAEAKRRAAQEGFDGHRTVWMRRTAALLLAAAHADGLEQVPRSWLRLAPRGVDAGHVLNLFGLLDTGPGLEPRSCRHCLSWGLRNMCRPCAAWRLRHPIGHCYRCRRRYLPVADRGGETLCRLCAVTWYDRSHSQGDGSVQLSLGGELAPRFPRIAGGKDRVTVDTTAQQVRVVSEHLVRRDQLALFDCTRDWSRLPPMEQLPAMTAHAQSVVAAMRLFAGEHQWDPTTTALNVRTLTVLLSWLGAEVPIRECDVRAVRTHVENATGNRVLTFLAAHGMLVASPAVTADELWVIDRLTWLPDGIAGELRTWLRIVRGKGRRRRRPRSWKVLRTYVYSVWPLLTLWSAQHTSLGQVTDQQVRDGMREVTGSAAKNRLAGLRSIFGALRAERCIPRDPTRSIKYGATVRVPVPLRDDQLRGLIDRADGPRAQLIVALVAIHALNVQELRNLTIDALDNRAGTLTVPRAHGRTHTLYLDDVTRELLRRWLSQRQEKWPTSPNPHLLISAYGAHAPNIPPLAVRTIGLIFRGLHLQAHRVRSDRILYEASVTEDPVLLMRVFGISTRTAMHYLHAAHPHRSVPLH